MPVEITQLTVRAKVVEETNANPCNTNEQQNDEESQRLHQRNEARRTTETTSELFKRQKER
jgi:hypothetical protein